MQEDAEACNLEDRLCLVAPQRAVSSVLCLQYSKDNHAQDADALMESPGNQRGREKDHLSAYHHSELLLACMTE